MDERLHEVLWAIHSRLIDIATAAERLAAAAEAYNEACNKELDDGS